MISIVIPAAGQGRRMGLGYNKVYAKLKDKPILITTLSKFINYPGVKEIIIVVEKESIETIKEYVKPFASKVNIKVVAGGKERQESVYNGLLALADNCKIVLIHDAARPLISEDVITRVIEGVKECGSAICAVPVKDTIAVSDKNNLVKEIPDRNVLWGIQTPQGFWKEIIVKAHEVAKKDEFLGTDDSSLVKRLGNQVKIVMGSYENIKITTVSDLVFAENILKNHNA